MARIKFKDQGVRDLIVNLSNKKLIVNLSKTIYPLLKITYPLFSKKRPKWKEFDTILNKKEREKKQFFFIQIGACDGMMRDPIYDYVIKDKWEGILVEPVGYLFHRLLKNYQNQKERLIFENVAISDKEEEKDFFHVRENHNLPVWTDGWGSFYIDNLLEHRFYVPHIDEYIVKEKVNCISLKELLEKHDIKSIDLLVIDTEGYEFEIIKQIDFKNIKPKIILYEFLHLSEKDRKECMGLLREKGYLLIEKSDDMIAYK